MVMMDHTVGLIATQCILAALFQREKTGEAQAIEVPMFESLVQLVLGDHLGGLSFEPQIGEAGYARLIAEHRRPYATSDGYVCVLIYNDKQSEAEELVERWLTDGRVEGKLGPDQRARLNAAIGCFDEDDIGTNGADSDQDQQGDHRD